MVKVVFEVFDLQKKKKKKKKRKGWMLGGKRHWEEERRSRAGWCPDDDWPGPGDEVQTDSMKMHHYNPCHSLPVDCALGDD